ncbi:MAG: ABC transporter ATP-binding protein [Bacteroides sp.]|uniref:ABC transporter ATP-binding protein n=1 Tax=Bacteroides sp. TaxID=29523 RepID=UPI002FC9BCEF
MNNLSQILNSATMGQPRRLRPLIGWTIAEYFFRGAPYGVMLLVVWEVFKPLQNPGMSINLVNIGWACLLLFISLICLWLIGKKAYLVAYRDGYEICCNGRLAVVDHLRRLPMSFFNSRDPGDIGAYIVSDYNNVEMLTTHLIGQFFGGLAMPIVALVSLLFFNWQLALAAAAVIPLAYPMMLLTNHFVATLGKRHQKIKTNAASRMIEYIQGIRLIKAFNLSGNKFERLERAFRDLKRESIRLEAAPAPSITLASTLLNGGLVLIMLLGFSMLLNAKVSMPVYIMFLLAGSAIYAPLINALTFIALINYMKLGAERIDALCKTPVLPEGIIEDVVNSEIEFRHVSFSYNADIPVLRDVSLTIPEKELTAFVGPSGSGKTTLTRLIARFWDVSEGEILFGGRNIKDYTVHTLMQQVSIVFQDVYLFNDTIYNNIRVGRETATREEIEAAARKAQCHNFITAMPDGYETMVGEGGSTLSGGEKQRISIARAILKDAPIVLLDEATASLDPENEVHIQDAINDLVKEKTVVIIAHRLGTVISANNIVVIDQGRVVQQGKHQALLAEEGLYRNLWEEQQRVKGWKFKQSNKQ